MQLSAETFRALTEEARPDVDHRSRRGAARVGLALRASIMVFSRPQQKLSTVNVRDLSKGGVGIVQNYEMAKGERFVLWLSSTGDGEGLAIVCTVKRCNRVGVKLFVVGASFTRHLTRSAIRALARVEDRPAHEDEEHHLDPEIARIRREVLR